MTHDVHRLKVAAQLASFDFARHLQWCEVCSVLRGRSGRTLNLCAAGLEASDKSIAVAQAYYESSIQRAKDTPPPVGQKFMPGTRVKIAKNLPEHMSHFPSDKMATVLYTYAHAYQRNDERSLKQYCLDIDDMGQVAWYDEEQLTWITT